MNKMERLPEWKQDTPREQLVALLSSIAGHNSVLRDDYFAADVTLQYQNKIDQYSKEALCILRYWSDLSKW